MEKVESKKLLTPKLRAVLEEEVSQTIITVLTLTQVLACLPTVNTL